MQRLMKQSNLTYAMHSAGTTVGRLPVHAALIGARIEMKTRLKLIIGLAEGSWDEVMKVIGRAHSMLHEKGIVRIQTDIRVGSRYVVSLFDW